MPCRTVPYHAAPHRCQVYHLRLHRQVGTRTPPELTRYKKEHAQSCVNETPYIDPSLSRPLHAEPVLLRPPLLAVRVLPWLPWLPWLAATLSIMPPMRSAVSETPPPPPHPSAN